MLKSIHLPIALWVLIGVAYAGGRWRDPAGRMDFIPFSGELLRIDRAGGRRAQRLYGVAVQGHRDRASWLVEAKQSVIENMAPVLTRLLTPLFALVLIAYLATITWTGRGIGFDHDLLTAFDLLLVVDLGLLLELSG